MSRIKHPNPQQGTFRDILGGVVFVDGFAEVDLADDPNLRDAYQMHGYEVEETPAEDPADAALAAAKLAHPARSHQKKA
ncbi:MULTISPECIES: hypothetical protein [unclassified Cryobacterium]|uniref:hypothetical protein n=1 Tax=unclassified Cryobacterium TaxID=2649013 RepID=UPI002AB376E5|nr:MULTISPECIES: hypothetical protein [unclassified Cryobacterium]MDY7542605.1 hypothetical protein [Cryobacterium sp. 5B3]MEB0264725.1 hypothetical protein [Cryobacterium sp. 10I5]MEB0273697.1 hypothetical protein [Cryobacterium sp. 5B3]